MPWDLKPREGNRNVLSLLRHLSSESAYVSEFTMILHIFRLCEFAILCHMNFTGDEFHNCEIHAFNIGESCDFHSFSHAITVVEFTRFTLDFTMNHLGCIHAVHKFTPEITLNEFTLN